MKTVNEVIQEYMKGDDPSTFDVTMGSEMIKDLMRLYAKEVIEECIDIMWDDSRADITPMRALKERL